jgi:hypothetical protein
MNMPTKTYVCLCRRCGEIERIDGSLPHADLDWLRWYARKHTEAAGEDHITTVVVLKEQE